MNLSTVGFRPKRVWSLVALIALTLGQLALTPGSASSTYVAFRVLGQGDFNGTGPSLTGMNYPTGAYIDPSGHILVADRKNNRILIYDKAPLTNGAQPDRILGQAAPGLNLPNRGGSPAANTLACPDGIWSDGRRVAVADRGNSRVLIWRDLWSTEVPEAHGVPADIVVGQPNMTSGPPTTSDPCAPGMSGTPSASTLSLPHGVTSDGSKLFVADTYNSRVLEWFQFPTVNGAAADLVIGQNNFNSSAANGGSTATASTLNFPVGVTTDGVRLIVADTLNNRTLIFNRLPSSGDPNGVAADVVVGQRTMTSVGINAAPPNDATATDGGLGRPSARTLHLPVSVSISSGRLAISDYFNNRVLIYLTIPTSNFATAKDVIGQSSFTSNGGGTSDRSLTNPWGVSIHQNGIVVSDAGNNRALVFPSPLSGSGVVTAQNGPSPLEVTLSWSAQPNATGYRIYRDGFWHFDVVGGSVTSLVDSGLSADIYRYSVSILSDLNRVEGSAIGSAEATAVGTAPALVVTRHDAYERYLAEGDSVASGDVAYGYNRAPHPYPQQISTYVAASPFGRAVSGSICQPNSGPPSVAERIAQEIVDVNPDLVTLGVGLNDMNLGYQDMKGAFSMVTYRDCLKNVVQVIRPSPSRTLLLMNMSHMTNYSLTQPVIGGFEPFSGSDAKRRAWNKVIRDVALHAGVPLVDVTGAMDQAMAAKPNESLLVGDNVHPNQLGHNVIADAVLSQLLNFYGQPGGPGFVGHPKAASATIEMTPGQQTATFEVSWSPPAGQVRTSNPYEISISPDATFRSGSTTSMTNSTTASVVLGAGQWFLRVRAFGPDGTPGAWSNWEALRAIQPPPPDREPPSVPGDPAAFIQTDRLHEPSTKDPAWQWSPSFDNQSGVDRYEVCWWPQGAGVDQFSCANAVYNRYVTWRLGPGVWHLAVRAIDKAGNVSAFSKPGSWVSGGIA